MSKTRNIYLYSRSARVYVRLWLCLGVQKPTMSEWNVLSDVTLPMAKQYSQSLNTESSADIRPLCTQTTSAWLQYGAFHNNVLVQLSWYIYNIDCYGSDIHLSYVYGDCTASVMSCSRLCNKFLFPIAYFIFYLF